MFGTPIGKASKLDSDESRVTRWLGTRGGEVPTLELGLGQAPVKVPVNGLLGEVPAVKTRIDGLGPLKFLQWKQENFFLKQPRLQLTGTEQMVLCNSAAAFAGASAAASQESSCRLNGSRMHGGLSDFYLYFANSHMSTVALLHSPDCCARCRNPVSLTIQSAWEDYNR